MALIKIQGSTKIQGKTIFDTQYGLLDSSAEAYIAAVEEADGQTLESGVKTAINTFVVGCKADGIWSALKASCILAGARTLTGALVPLVGTAPTNNNFVSGDYNRETGLKGNGSSKNINANRNHNADAPQQHLFAHLTEANSANKYTIVSGSNSYLYNTATTAYHRAYGGSSIQAATVANVLGGYGVTRVNSSQVSRLLNGAVSTGSSSYQAPGSGNILIFGTTGTENGNARLSFYSIGGNIDLALLNSRVSTLMTDIAAAI